VERLIFKLAAHTDFTVIAVFFFANTARLAHITMEWIIFISLDAKLALITVKILFLLANIAYIALFTMKHVGALNALVDCIALPAEVVVFWDTFEALL
jgi:hypothetical protein